jgi:hypothetical protein
MNIFVPNEAAAGEPSPGEYIPMREEIPLEAIFNYQV